MSLKRNSNCRRTPPSQISLDIEDGKFEPLLENRVARRLKELDEHDPLVTALTHHRRMVWAKVLNGQEELREEYRLFCAALTANDIAEKAIGVAYEKGRLAELGLQLDEIKAREGLQENEYWPSGEGPVDYQQLSSETNDLSIGVVDAVYTTVLRRYQLGHIADLYENDRRRHDELRERGRKLVFGPMPADLGG